MAYTNFHVTCKQNLDLAVDEAISATKAYDPKLKVAETPAGKKDYFKDIKEDGKNLVIIRTSTPEWLVSQRLAMTKYSGTILDSFSDLFVAKDMQLKKPNRKTRNTTIGGKHGKATGMACKQYNNAGTPFSGSSNYSNSGKNSLLLTGNPSSFSCKAVNLAKDSSFAGKKTESLVGRLVQYLTGHKVSLENPQSVIYLIKSTNFQLLGYHHNNGGSFSHYTQKKRQYRFHGNFTSKRINSHPSQLDSKLARAMVNLSGLREGHTICDPFCGTGTIPLEANCIGINAIGLDYDKNMCKMSLDNIRANKFSKKTRIINAGFDQFTILQDRFDGIVTDLPYGIASKSSEKVDSLIEKFACSIPRKKRFVIMCKKGGEKPLEDRLNPSRKYEIYRHKSLTRVILAK